MRLIKFFFLLVMLTGTAMSATASLTLSNLNNTATDGSSVTIGSTTHGTVTTDKAQAGPGERVTLTAIYCNDTWNISTSTRMFYANNNLVGAVGFSGSDYNSTPSTDAVSTASPRQRESTSTMDARWL